MNELKNCPDPDCGVKPGMVHVPGCDVEICSNCGCQKIGCDCKSREHDPRFARWTGIWPGELESKYLGIDLNEFYEKRYNEIFFIKPKIKGGNNE